MTTSRPLTGLNIVVTRPPAQATELAQRIQQEGGKVVLYPLLEISPAADPQHLSEIVSRLDEFNLAIFISPNAVKYGMEAIQAAGSLPSGLKIATVGQGSAKALRARGVVNIIVPQDRFDSEALLALPELQNVADWRIIIFRGDGGRELLGDMLKMRGAVVEYAECYQRSKPQLESAVLLAADPHAITVTSSEALGYLWDILNTADRTYLSSVPLLVPHQRIANSAHQLGWKKVITTAGGDDGLLSSLVAWAKDRKSL